MSDINVSDLEGIVSSDEAELNTTNVNSEEGSIEQNVAPKTAKDIKDKNKVIRLPLTRVKSIMKFDPDCSIISRDAIILVTKATELFVEFIGKEAVKYTIAGKRKTLMKRDLTTVIETFAPLCFLEGMLD